MNKYQKRLSNYCKHKLTSYNKTFESKENFRSYRILTRKRIKEGIKDKRSDY